VIETGFRKDVIVLSFDVSREQFRESLKAVARTESHLATNPVVRAYVRWRDSQAKAALQQWLREAAG